MSARNPFLSVAAAAEAAPVLVAASDPADVPLAAGSTSSSASARVFTAPTGGSGSATLAVVASAGSLAGDNVSGWYVTGLADGSVVTITGEWTDDTTGQVARNSYVVSVSSGGSWVLIDELDFTGLDVADISPPDATVQTISLTKSATEYATVYVDYSGTGLVHDVTTGADGLRSEWVSGASNYLTAAVDLAALLGKSTPMTEADWRGLVCVQAIFADIVYPPSNAQRLHFSVANVNNNLVLDGDSMTVSLSSDGLSGSIVGFHVGSDVNEYTEASLQPTAVCMTLIIVDGTMAKAYINYGSGYVDPYTEDHGPMLLYRAPVKGAPYPVQLPTPFIGASWRRQVNATLAGVRVLRYQ